MSIMLQGIDVRLRSFEASLETGRSIVGRIGDNLPIDEVDPARVPLRYTATFTHITCVQYAYDEDVDSWILEALDPMA